MADRKMDESVEGLMANPIKDVVTVLKMQLKRFLLKLLTVFLKMFPGDLITTAAKFH